MYPPTPQERVGSIDAAHLAVGACAGRQAVASAAQHEYHAFVDVTRPLPWVGHGSGGACASKDARTQRTPGQQTPTWSIEPAESALVARNFGGLFKGRL